MENLTQKDLETLGQMAGDFSKQTAQEEKMTEGIANAIKILFDEYKKDTVEPSDVVITVETSLLYGNMEIFHVKSIERANPLKYESGSYDYITIAADSEKTILWTDFSETEPFNRQGVFYVGASFKNLTLVKTTDKYREFEIKRENPKGVGSSSFPVSGFKYNNFWKQVSFGICLKKEHAELFVLELKKLLNK